MNHLFRSLLIQGLMLGGSILFAQEAGSADKKPPAGRTACFVATSIPEGLENPVDLMTEGKITKVTLSKRMTSAPVKIPADGVLRIVRLAEKQPEPSKPIYDTLAQAVIPEGMKDVLIILVPVARKEGSPQVFQAKTQDLASFKGGDYLYLNLTTLNIAVQLGEKKIGLRPGESGINRIDSLTAPTNAAVSYLYFQPEESKWNLISSSTIVMQPTRREICIFSWDPVYGRIDYHGVTFPVAQ